MSEKRRRAPLALALMFSALLVISSAFLAEHFSHECTGEGCAVCEVIAVCETLLAGCAAAAVTAAAAGAFFKTAFAAAAVTESRRKDTPVRLKVLMLN